MAAVNQPKRGGKSRTEKPQSPTRFRANAGDTPTLSVSREKVCHIVFKVRQFDVKDLPTFPDDGSNPADDAEWTVLEDRPDDPVVRELAAFISALNFDDRSTL